MIEPVMPTYARTDLSFERGEGASSTRQTGDVISTSAPALP